MYGSLMLHIVVMIRGTDGGLFILSCPVAVKADKGRSYFKIFLTFYSESELRPFVEI